MVPIVERRSLLLSSARMVSLAVVLPMIGVGCAAQDKFDQTVTANRSLQEQLASMENERDAARDSLTAVQSQLGDTTSAYATLQARHEELNTSFRAMDKANQETMIQIAALEIGPLPAEVQTAIGDLAAAHPEVLSFDARMGMVRFSSDFTFDLGSIALKDDAQTTLVALAAILQEPAAGDLEVRIIGHTDNVPIRQAATRRAHPTNTHLSVHRAIAVGEALSSSGVDGARIQVAGYGEHRPIVTNGAGGAAANRRVEIFLAPLSEYETHLSAAPPDAPDASSASAEPMK